MSSTHEVTRLLDEWARGNQQALEQLMPLVYGELRQIAASYLRKERQGHTLQPTAVVHEAYIRLVHQKNPNWEDRKNFFGVAARLIRQRHRYPVAGEEDQAQALAARARGEAQKERDQLLQRGGRRVPERDAAVAQEVEQAPRLDSAGRLGGFRLLRSSSGLHLAHLLLQRMHH